MTEPVPANQVNEVTITTRRKHWINVLPLMVGCVVMLLVLMAGLVYYGAHTSAIDRYVPAGVVGIAAMIYLVLVVMIGALGYWVYLQNRLVLTNHHIMQYTRRGIFDQTVAQFSLIKLQDVTSHQRGLMANLLGYGNIEIETAGEDENFEFNQVPNPKELADMIMQAHEALESEALIDAKKL